MLSSVAQRDEPLAVLHRWFGHSFFRPGQEEAIRAVCAGGDALVLLPTGAGKSLCYQVPALALRARGLGPTVVVSPLIALMNDQVDALRARGVAAAGLHSHLGATEQRQAVTDFAAGKLDMLYVSPERAALAGMRRLLGRARVALLAVDE